MKQYRLEGRMDLLPDDIWTGCDTTIYLPSIPKVRPTEDVLFWAVDESGNRHALAWHGGLAFDFPKATRQAREIKTRRSPRPWMTFCPFHPHRIPPRLRRGVRGVLGAGSRLLSARRQAFPRWPIEPSLAVWKSIAQAAGFKSPWPIWPRDKQYAVCLSHDVDTAEGQKNAVALAQIEQRLGLRSAWFLCPGNYQIDRGVWSEMADRGHEIGCHGLFHDFKLPYLSPPAIGERIDLALRLLETFDVSGFRSPAFLRTTSLMNAVTDRFSYDSSVPDTVCLHGADGSASVEPYPLGKKVEVPVTIPYDGELIALGMSADEQLDAWLTKMKWIKGREGLIHMLTHPERQFSGNGPSQTIYRRMLEHLVADYKNTWFALPCEIAQHSLAMWNTFECADYETNLSREEIDIQITL